MAEVYSGDSEKIKKWLQLVEGHLTPEGVEYVKLCLYSEIDFTQYESITKSSQLFGHLLRHCCNENETQALQMFANALKHVGSDLRGTHLVENCLPEYGLACPAPLKEETLSKETKFCLCLVKIGTKSRGLKLEVRLAKHFCRPPYLNMHYENIQHLPDLFVRLMQRRFIQWDNTVLLTEYFKKCGAQQCLRYLHQYYIKVGLQPLPEFDGHDDGMLLVVQTVLFYLRWSRFPSSPDIILLYTASLLVP